MIRTTIAAALLATTLTACATIPMAPPSLDLLDQALDTAPDTLEQRANAGEARAQYALAIVLTHALNGRPRNSALALELRRRALAQRGYTPITQYIAGLNGAPGRTAIINIARYDLNGYEGQANDACASALASGRETQSQFDACQGEPTFRAFQLKWSRARPG